MKFNFKMFRFLFKVQCNVVVVRFTALYHSKKLNKTDENWLEPLFEVKQNTPWLVQ